MHYLGCQKKGKIKKINQEKKLDFKRIFEKLVSFLWNFLFLFHVKMSFNVLIFQCDLV